MVLYGVKIHPNEGEDREETQGPEHFTRALLMIHELGESIQGVGYVPEVSREMKVTCREQVNRSEYGNKEAIYYEQENGIVTSDQSHKCKLLLVLILNKVINAIDEHMIL